MECNVSTYPNVSRNYTEEEKACYLAHLQLYSTYTMIPTIIYLVVLCVAGVIGNSVVLFVYSQRFRSTASGTFIMAIAVFDLLANLVLIPGDIYGMFHHWDFDMVYLCKLRSYGHAVTHGASSFFLVALAVTRYRKICKPFNKQVSIQQARTFCIGVTFLEIAISILYFITQGIQKKKTPNQNIFGYVCSVDDKFNGTVIHKLNTVIFVVFFITVSSLLVVLYVKIWVTAKRHHNRKPSACAREKQETEMASFACASCEQTSNNTDSVLVHTTGDIQADQNIETTKPVSLLPNTFLEMNRSKQNTMAVSSFQCDQEHQLKSPKDITSKQKNKSFSIRKKSLSKSFGIFDRIPSGENSSPHQIKYPCILKKSASDTNNFKSDTHVYKSFKKPKTSTQKRTATLNTFNINETVGLVSEIFKGENTSTRRRRGSRRIICMLVTISSIYILSLLPFMVFNAIKTVAPEFPESMNFHVQSLYHFLFRSYLINTAVNPIVYSFCDVKFRKECLSQFKRITGH